MKTLIVLLGPTGIGKTDLSIELAKHFQSVIVSSDSRQLYKELSIGTAVPDEQQLQAVDHYFIHSRSIFNDYTAGKFELDAIALIYQLFQLHDVLFLVGGSGLYIDAVCRGIDKIPGTDKSLREEIIEQYKNEGLESLHADLKRLDPDTYDQIDIANPQRVMRALEVCLTAGKPYSSLKQNFAKTRNFNIIKIGLQIPRQELYNRINSRVDKMFESGLLEEATSLYPFRTTNALQTVGYKEIFESIDGKCNIKEATELIKRNTRRYAKRQISWFARYDDINWFAPSDSTKILNFLESHKLS